MDLTDNLRSQHLTVRSNETINLLNDIEEDLVLTVLDARGTPGEFAHHVLGHVDLGLVKLLTL